MEPTILYEDEDILVIDKPAGIVVHPDGRTEEESVSGWFVAKYPKAKDVGEPTTLSNGEVVDRSGVVHRLDRETSGALILAKTENGFMHLKRQFLDREIEKTYFAFVHGSVKDDHGSITFPIGKSPTDFRRYSSGRGAVGEKRDALTYFQVVKRFEGGTLVEVRPKTGRTHQIRVHFQNLQRPLVGDTLYAKGKDPILGFARVALHAREVTFKNTKGKVEKVKAPFPADFLHAFKEIGYAPKLP